MGRVCSGRSRPCLCVVGVSRGARFLRCCRRGQPWRAAALPGAHAAARMSTALSRRCSHCSQTKTFDPLAPAQNWSACAGVRLARSPLGSAAHRCALPYGLPSDCAYACWSWYEARAALGARPRAVYASEVKTGWRAAASGPWGFANAPHAGPCEHRECSHGAHVFSSWPVSAESKHQAAPMPSAQHPWRAA